MQQANSLQLRIAQQYFEIDRDKVARQNITLSVQDMFQHGSNTTKINTLSRSESSHIPMDRCGEPQAPTVAVIRSVGILVCTRSFVGFLSCPSFETFFLRGCSGAWVG